MEDIKPHDQIDKVTQYETIIKKLIYYNLKKRHTEDGQEVHYRIQYDFPIVRMVPTADVQSGAVLYQHLVEDMYQAIIVGTEE